MIRRRKRRTVVPEREKKELQVVKRRLDRLEPRVAMLETEVKLFRRETP